MTLDDARGCTGETQKKLELERDRWQQFALSRIQTSAGSRHVVERRIAEHECVRLTTPGIWTT
jgi:hypothetical protein